jgi:aminoglycoside phosphotransferase (APT) family kinase protein
VATPAAEVEVDDGLVRALLEEQHPDLAALPLRHAATGWDNVIFRLGDALSVRLPRRFVASWLLAQEQRWLPVLAVDLPLPVPVPVRVGQPGCGYPWPWSVGPWFPGDTAEATPPRDLDAAAGALGRFLAAVHRPAPPDAPRNLYRGIPLAERDQALHDGLELLGERVDQAAALRLWERVLASRPWDREPVWLHGDVHPLNLVVHGGELSAVIDFGDMCAGDPASDLAIGWMLFTGSSRQRFRETAGTDGAVDVDTWLRAWGWALALGVAFANGDDRVREIGFRTLRRALTDAPGAASLR